MYPGIAATVPRGLQSVRSHEWADRPRARNHDLQEPAYLGADHRASGVAGGSTVSRLRFAAKRAGAQARADRPGEQYRVAQAVDEYGAYARLALGSGTGRVRDRHPRPP